MSRVLEGPGKLIDVIQDIETLVATGKVMAIAGTGFLIAKNYRVGIPYAMRLGYLVAKHRIVSEYNLVKDVAKLTRSTYFGDGKSKTKAQVKKPPTPVKGRPISSKPLRPGRPPGGFGGFGGINPVFTWGGLVLGALVYADQKLGFLEETDPITGDVPVA